MAAAMATDEAAMTAVATQIAARSAAVGSARFDQTSMVVLCRLTTGSASLHVLSVVGSGKGAGAEAFPGKGG